MSIEAQQSLFDACLDASSDEERERLLQACADPELRHQVRELLRAHVRVTSSFAAASAPEFPRLAAPHQIGPYRIVKHVGEGGMGEVYLAEQESPVRRRVALKILKFGIATREVIARFELERQALALLAHPNIARIFDAGTTPDGRPYFVMEYVPGIPITRYCDDLRLGIDARLALCRQVCAAVQHAHLRGIIHRDLKPSNIMVAELDEVPVPKIIDFGIAKATTMTAGYEDAQTRIGNLLGTPEYMSPEQAQLSPLDIDARTDVYSLGIVLYELLTGARPYVVTGDIPNPASLLHEILEREAERPSAAAARITPESVARAERRGLVPATLAAKLRGDLDWIALKSIEKDREQRYDSPAGLAADLERHSQHEPVLAGPPSTLYRVGKFVRRHRLAVTGLSAAFVAVIVFGFSMAWLAQQAASERDRANQEAAVARRVTQFTAGLFELANPMSMGAREVSARELLDAGVRRLESQLGEQRREVRAALLEAAGNAYRGIGAYAEAERLLGQAIALNRESVQSEPSAYAQSLLSLSLVKRDQGDFERATVLARDALQALASDPDHRIGLNRAKVELAEILRRRTELSEAMQLVEQVLATDPPSGADAATSAHALMLSGRIKSAQGNLDQAIELLQRAHREQLQASGPLGELTLEAKSALADALVTKGDPAGAEVLLRSLLQETRQIYGDEHAQVAITMNNLANATSDIPEKFEEAAVVYMQAADMLRRTLGPMHNEVGTTYNNLGALYLKTKEWQKADEAYRNAIEIRSARLGEDNPDTASSRNGRALALSKLGRDAEAEQLLRRGVETYAATLGAEHWRTGNARRQLAVVLANQKKFAEAGQQIDAGYAILVKALGEDHPRTVSAKEARAEIEAARNTKVATN